MAVLTSPFSGIGTTIGYKTGTGGTYTLLGLVTDDASWSGIETTSIPLPLLNQIYLNKTPGRIDSGQYTFTLYFVPGDAGVIEFLNTLGPNRTSFSSQVMFPDGTSPTTGSTGTFTGFVSSLVPGNLSGDDAPHLEVTIDITSQIIWAVGT